MWVSGIVWGILALARLPFLLVFGMVDLSQALDVGFCELNVKLTGSGSSKVADPLCWC